MLHRHRQLCTHTHTYTHKHIHTHTCTHIHVHTQTLTQRDCWGKGHYYSTEMLWEEKCLDFVFEGRERSRLSDILGEVVPDVRTETGERVKAMSFAVEASEFACVCVWCRVERVGRAVKQASDLHCEHTPKQVSMQGFWQYVLGATLTAWLVTGGVIET